MAFGYRSQKNLLSKIATSNGHGENSPYFDGWKAYDSDPYHPTRNPAGVIQMGLAENQLCHDLSREWIEDNPAASICTVEGAKYFKDVAIFQDYHGLPEFRKGIANFMGKVRDDRVKFDPERIVMSGGATGAHETMAFCLADRGDAFLVPTPYYPGFDRDLRWRTGVQLLPVICESKNSFKITKQALESGYDNARNANINVKGLLVANPSNPLGTVMDRETLKTVAAFVTSKNIHLVCDEIYAGTVFDPSDFISIGEIVEENVETADRGLFHIIHSLSKEMGLPGFRIGIIYSYNDKVVDCARKMSSFGLVSTQTQWLIGRMLSDEKFVENFIFSCRCHLKKRHDDFTRGLSRLGIGCLKSNGGLFFWMDLRRLLRESTPEGEMELWRVIIREVKLNVSPGLSFHCDEPGWFRVCFANMDDETMRVALRRIKGLVLKANTVEVPTRRAHWQRFEDVLMTPHRMSPHSPASSPLVRAAT